MYTSCGASIPDHLPNDEGIAIFFLPWRYLITCVLCDMLIRRFWQSFWKVCTTWGRELSGKSVLK